MLNNLNEKKEADIIITRLNTNRDMSYEESMNSNNIISSKSKESIEETIDAHLSMKSANIINDIYSKI